MSCGRSLNNQVRTITIEQALTFLSEIGRLEEFTEEFAAEVFEKTATSVADGLAHIAGNDKPRAIKMLAR